MTEKKHHQPPLNIDEQIANLKSINLTIEDENSAKKFLNDVSYFRFIKAYSLGLKPRNGSYKNGVTFNQLVELYLFNANFRHILFEQIEKIEVNLRCRLANYFSAKYGVLGYENSCNFENPLFHETFILDIKDEIKRNSRAPFVRNFVSYYENGTIPFYALVEILSFGELSKLFKNMHNVDKKAIAIKYNVGYTYFESWIESISYVRNICAHYGRLYNAKLTKTPRLYEQYREQGISNIRIFGVLCCLKHLLPSDEHWLDFVNTLDKMFIKYPHVDKSTMSFPENWKEILLNNTK